MATLINRLFITVYYNLPVYYLLQILSLRLPSFTYPRKQQNKLKAVTNFEIIKLICTLGVLMGNNRSHNSLAY